MSDTIAMTIYLPGEVVMVNEPFTAGGAFKLRPGLIVLDTGDDDVVVARITRRRTAQAYEVAISEWQEAGLLEASTVRVHKLFTANKRLVLRRIGQLTREDIEAVRISLRLLWSAWLSEPRP
jgi:mRNA interferase MazF